MRLRDIPNIISLARLLAVIPVVFLLLEHAYGWALVLFALAGISDGLDGFLAKRYGWRHASAASSTRWRTRSCWWPVFWCWAPSP